VIPEDSGRDGVVRFLEALTAMGGASFLCVIKSCGPESKGTLSFPRRGTTIALDIPARSGTQALVDALNRVLLDEGGRIYLAKDTFTRAEDFRRMDPRLEQFQAVRDVWDPERKLRSAQSVRLFGDPE
jgi:FAD/FMN-containing dehydrogenase